jgi:signal transduction histidine kinase
MKKVALVFVVAVLMPSLVLAWLAVRSLRDQQFLLERQQALLYQGVADRLAKDIGETLTAEQHTFSAKVMGLVREHGAIEAARGFDNLLRRDWPLAQVGFVVTLTGAILSPTAASGPEARKFLGDNGRFLANREVAEVYLNPKQVLNNTFANVQPSPSAQQNEGNLDQGKRTTQNRGSLTRNVIPQQQAQIFQKGALPDESQQQQLSKVAVSEAEFRQLIGDENEGMLARFADNKLNVLLWCRPAVTLDSSEGKQKSSTEGDLVFGAQLNLRRVLENLRRLVDLTDPAIRQEICVALLDDTGKPALLSHPGCQASWKHPLVATEIGEVLPHWEMAVYLLNPDKLTQSARTLKLTLGLLIAVLVLAIGTGSWLIVADLNRQLTLARQKTDFVSNVSHELKTPLTSIRMFSELLADGRVTDASKQRSYLGIITSEAGRLTRLINNVLDFARIERGEKKYNFVDCDAVALVRETAETVRPHLEAAGFQFHCAADGAPMYVTGDRDALAQVLVNLISNAEKYSGERKEVEIRIEGYSTPLPYAEVSVCDRGMGVPKGSEEKIFEKFYRAHDSLSSGIQGSGLGLTLARQIARAHGGEVFFRRREGDGSCFALRLPMLAKNRESELTKKGEAP